MNGVLKRATLLFSVQNQNSDISKQNHTLKLQQPTPWQKLLTSLEYNVLEKDKFLYKEANTTTAC